MNNRSPTFAAMLASMGIDRPGIDPDVTPPAERLRPAEPRAERRGGAIASPSVRMARDTRTGADRWVAMFARAETPIADNAAERAYLARCADGLESCGCVAHWRAYMDSHPPTLDTPTRYAAWLFDARNAIARRLKREVWPGPSLP